MSTSHKADSMRQSQLFTKTQKQAPTDEVSKNAQLLIRAGYLHKEMAGVYTYLPLGLRVLNNITSIIREEMNAIGGQEMLLTTLQSPELWKKSGRWMEEEKDDSGLPWFKTKLSGGGELGVANTHEEVMTNIMRAHVSSYKNLPFYTYQFQNKFRNELRAKSGIMRCREFIMKDLYSFSRNEEEFKTFYESCAEAYLRIYERVGLGDVTYRTFASGGAFSKYSDEFQTLSEAGEDTIYVDETKRLAVNKEVYTDDVLKDLKLDKSKLVEKKAIEVGNIFTLGTRYSDAIGLKYKDEEGKENPVFMGSYGIGLGRLLGTVAEVLSDEKGLVWPRAVAPFEVHLVRLGDTEKVVGAADTLRDTLTSAGISVLYDDRDIRPGQKFADSELMGLPVRVVISENTVQAGKLEVVNRTNGEKKMQTEEELLEELSI